MPCWLLRQAERRFRYSHRHPQYQVLVRNRVGPAFDADSTDSIFCPHCDLVHIEEQRKRL